MASIRVISAEALRESSTRAAQQYVTAVRKRLASELERHGPAAQQRRSYQRLERSLSPAELRRCWPAADIDQALRAEL